ncbi:phosphate signaling complex protein PhoU [Bacteriovorax sp. DB6_IX]|uniref:phosphate signaling complex protein PhoU n=1 Tax=Bacteriovorax sp. DB6_IX TaxID=1353530 RepID=UPI00038A2D5F|nr:phosphate signaling complex protein PhoU [Bacteriovorax sp. DB6_IX]EQC50934.1 phosphate transport system regulatory protein PhoU [Bacteriovorax sp. DB6_IX]
MDLTVSYLREEVTKMAALVEQILSQSINQAFSKDDIYALEKQINDYHKSIDDNIFKYIALKAPAASDLRTALAIMKMNSELERIGDQAVNIKRYFSKVTLEHPLLTQLQDEVIIMIKKSFDSFANRDMTIATDVIKTDKEVNNIHREIIREYFRKMKEENFSFDEGFSILRIAKILERIGDHATNICEDIIFLETGNDIRHPNN